MSPNLQEVPAVYSAIVAIPFKHFHLNHVLTYPEALFVISLTVMYHDASLLGSPATAAFPSCARCSRRTSSSVPPVVSRYGHYQVPK